MVLKLCTVLLCNTEVVECVWCWVREGTMADGAARLALTVIQEHFGDACQTVRITLDFHRAGVDVTACSARATQDSCCCSLTHTRAHVLVVPYHLCNPGRARSYRARSNAQTDCRCIRYIPMHFHFIIVRVETRKCVPCSSALCHHPRRQDPTLQ